MGTETYVSGLSRPMPQGVHMMALTAPSGASTAMPPTIADSETGMGAPITLSKRPQTPFQMSRSK